MDIASAEYPDTLYGRSLTPLPGLRFMPTLQNKKDEQVQHETLYWEHLGHQAIRHGEWKLVKAAGQTELFNIAKDRTELNNLADDHPEIVEKLESMWEVWYSSLY